MKYKYLFTPIKEVTDINKGFYQVIGKDGFLYYCWFNKEVEQWIDNNGEDVEVTHILDLAKLTTIAKSCSLSNQALHEGLSKGGLR